MPTPTYTEQTGSNNPFNGFNTGGSSAPSFGDIDSDGDLDLIAGKAGGSFDYYKNTGSSSNPVYTQQFGSTNPFNGFNTGGSSAPSFGDIDGDGDLDLIAGKGDGSFDYYKNTGTSSNPVYTQQSGSANPFSGFDTGYYSTPSFGDIDGDGDLDLIAGKYDGSFDYYKNTGTSSNPVYTQQSGSANPFDGFNAGSFSAPLLGDIDGDGDLDLIAGKGDGSFDYYKNTGTSSSPVYTQQSGSANPFNGFDVGLYSKPSLGDIDGDSDLDMVSGSISGTFTTFKAVVCFLAGTLIATPAGEQPIETLQIGDLITTADGPQAVKFLARSTRSIAQLQALGKMPIRINQAALGSVGPAHDTFVSPSHAIFFSGCLVEAAALVNGTSIQQLNDWPEAELTYYNIELERHGLITANGLPVESYFANYRSNGFSRDCWDNYQDYVALYGPGDMMEELAIPRIPFARQIPIHLRQALQSHADSSGSPASAIRAVDMLPCIGLLQ